VCVCVCVCVCFIQVSVAVLLDNFVSETSREKQVIEKAREGASEREQFCFLSIVYEKQFLIFQFFINCFSFISFSLTISMRE
jgi:hypothetical protein